MNIPDLGTFGGLSGLGVLIAGLGFAYAQFNSGAGKAKDDLIETLKESVIAEQARAMRLTTEKATLINSHQSQINELNNKIGKLQGLYESSEQSKKEYLAILQGRDPAQQKFMELMVKAATQSDTMQLEASKYMAETTGILTEIRTFMRNLNVKAEEGSRFQKDITSATQKETGKPLRK